MHGMSLPSVMRSLLLLSLLLACGGSASRAGAFNVPDSADGPYMAALRAALPAHLSHHLGPVADVPEREPTSPDRSVVHTPGHSHYCTAVPQSVVVPDRSIGFLCDGSSTYGNNARCDWAISAEQQAPPTQPPHVVFFWIESFETECLWDKLTIFDGATVTSRKIASLSGSMKHFYSDFPPSESLGSDPQPPPPAREATTHRAIMSSGANARVLFKSDSAVALEGFRLGFSVATCPAECMIDNRCVPDSCQCSIAYKPDQLDMVSDILCTRAPEHSFSPDVALRRAGHVSALLNLPSLPGAPAEQALLVHGGTSFDSPFLSDTVIYSFSSERWTPVLSPSHGHPVLSPSGRHSHALAVADPSQGVLFVFGGYTSNGESDELWIFNFGTLTWRQVQRGPHTSDWPPPLFGHSLSFVPASSGDGPGHLYLIGGFDGRAKRINSVVWRFSLDTRTWERVGLAAPESLTAGVFGHAAAFVPAHGSIVVHGGIRLARGAGGGTIHTSTISRDTYVFSPVTHQWTRMITRDSAYRFMHRMALVPDLSLPIPIAPPSPLDGGTSSGGAASAMEAAVAPLPLPIAGNVWGLVLIHGGFAPYTHSIPSVANRCVFSDTFVLDTICSEWTALALPGNSALLARSGHTLEVFPARLGRFPAMLLFGGFNGQMMADMVTYDLGDRRSANTQCHALFCHQQTGNLSKFPNLSPCQTCQQSPLCSWRVLDLPGLKGACLPLADAPPHNCATLEASATPKATVIHGSGGEDHCQSLASCGACAKAPGCAWCPGLRQCQAVALDAAAAVASPATTSSCPDGLDVSGRCPAETCPRRGSCFECLQPLAPGPGLAALPPGTSASVVDRCQWCSESRTCVALGRCATGADPIAAPDVELFGWGAALCPAQCDSFADEFSCYSGSRPPQTSCFWCSTIGRCVDASGRAGASLMLAGPDAPFGAACPAWTSRPELPLGMPSTHGPDALNQPALPPELPTAGRGAFSGSLLSGNVGHLAPLQYLDLEVEVPAVAADLVLQTLFWIDPLPRGVPDRGETPGPPAADGRGPEPTLLLHLNGPSGVWSTTNRLLVVGAPRAVSSLGWPSGAGRFAQASLDLALGLALPGPLRGLLPDAALAAVRRVTAAARAATGAGGPWQQGHHSAPGGPGLLAGRYTIRLQNQGAYYIPETGPGSDRGIRFSITASLAAPGTGHHALFPPMSGDEILHREGMIDLLFGATSGAWVIICMLVASVIGIYLLNLFVIRRRRYYEWRPPAVPVAFWLVVTPGSRSPGVWRAPAPPPKNWLPPDESPGGEADPAEAAPLATATPEPLPEAGSTMDDMRLLMPGVPGAEAAAANASLSSMQVVALQECPIGGHGQLAATILVALPTPPEELQPGDTTAVLSSLGLATVHQVPVSGAYRAAGRHLRRLRAKRMAAELAAAAEAEAVAAAAAAAETDAAEAVDMDAEMASHHASDSDSGRSDDELESERAGIGPPLSAGPGALPVGATLRRSSSVGSAHSSRHLLAEGGHSASGHMAGGRAGGLLRDLHVLTARSLERLRTRLAVSTPHAGLSGPSGAGYYIELGAMSPTGQLPGGARSPAEEDPEALPSPGNAAAPSRSGGHPEAQSPGNSDAGTVPLLSVAPIPE
ncbi:hypothetical protein H696_02071 [Fonticula alba]|uniref:CUB domain-containing protein n=1 Tax=Fonticula alba TaxID=691883 RepID=A0A058ZB10_FONAL|nr:hypothetical protein H696_02071 [Fonticula alba]KCV71121.1 hypothetical protein H696_02071 [Fonticula alba]|eukprot:XP_009494244.1 hypothetical protein H696_02071 [Fonticula alba]